MILSHYTAEPFILDRDRHYSQDDFGNGKPQGLWLSVDGEYGWPEWCRDEEWRTESLAHRTRFTLAPTANLVRLTTLDELKAFTAEFNGPPQFGDLKLAAHWIDWTRVARRHDGILITPYCWEARLDLDTIWYYGWDCASGCIWDLDALTLADEQVPR